MVEITSHSFHSLNDSNETYSANYKVMYIYSYILHISSMHLQNKTVSSKCKIDSVLHVQYCTIKIDGCQAINCCS